MNHRAHYIVPQTGRRQQSQPPLSYHPLHDVVEDWMTSWMTSNFFLLNSDKSEVIVFGAKFLRESLDHINTQDGFSLASSFSVRNLGVIFPPKSLLTHKSHWRHIISFGCFLAAGPGRLVKVKILENNLAKTAKQLQLERFLSQQTNDLTKRSDVPAWLRHIQSVLWLQPEMQLNNVKGVCFFCNYWLYTIVN